MTTSKILYILLVALIIITLIPAVISGEENSSQAADTGNETTAEGEVSLIAENRTAGETPVSANDTGNSSEETPPPEQNQSVNATDTAIQKAFTGWYDQGMKALTAKNYQSASEAFAAALRLEKGSEKAQIGYAQALSELGRAREALPFYQQIQNTSPDNTGILIPLGRALNAAGSHDTAQAILLNATELFPENTGGWNQLAAAYAGQSRYEEALTVVRKSLEISLNQSEGWGELGAILSGQGRFYEAIAAFEKAVTLDPKNADAWTGLGDTWAALTRYENADTSYLTATGIQPTNREIWLKIAKNYENLGKSSEAADAWIKGGKINLTGPDESQKPQENQSVNQTAGEPVNSTGNITEADETVTGLTS